MISAIILTGGYVVNRSVADLDAAQKSVQHTYLVLDKIALTLSIMQDIETGERGYVVTQNKDFLQPYNAGLANIHGAVSALRDFTSNDPVQQERISKLENLITQKIDYSTGLVVMVDSGKSDQAVKDMSTKQGKMLMDEIRQTINQMQETEFKLLDDHSNNAQTSLSNLSYLSYVVSGIVIGIVIIVHVILDKETKGNTKQEQKLQAEYTGAKEKRQLEYTDAKEKQQAIDTDAKEKRQLEYTDAKEVSEKLKGVAKDEFSAMITHELKTPLAPIIGYCKMLKTSMLGRLDEEQLDAIEVIDKNAKRLESLITDILDVRKLDLDQLRFNMSDLSLDEFFSNLDSDYRKVLENKRCQFTTSLYAKNLVMKTDKSRLRQVFGNLISNSTKFVPDNKGKIETGCTKESNSLVLYVRDNGIGILQEKQKELFQKFYQIDTSARRSTDGTGLGLAISKGIVEKLGGTISVESDGKTGTTFYMKFPMTANAA